MGNSSWNSHLALVGVEVVFPLGLAIGDAADPTSIAPGDTVVIAEQAENPIPLQCPMATHNEPALPRLPLFLWGKDWGAADGDTEEAQRQGRGTPHLLSVRIHSVSFCSVLAVGPTSLANTH